jgi:PAS domain S-box-containing protein
MKPATPSPSEVKTEVLNQLHPASQLLYFQNRCQELEEKLQFANERFDYVQRATSDAVWDWDLIKNTGWYSDALSTHFGYQPSELIDGVKFWYEHIHPEDESRVTSAIHAVIDNGENNWQDQYRFRRADGSYAWVFDRGYVIRDAKGNAVRMVGSMQDVTTQVEARETLRQSEEKFRATFRQAAVGISIATPTGKFLEVNEAFPRIFGYTHEEFMAKDFSSLSHPDELEGDKMIMSRLLNGHTQVAAREKRYVHKSGKTIWGRVFGTVIFDSEKKPKYFIGVLEDITEQHNALAMQRENDERLRLVMESAKIGTWDFEPRSGKLFWDARCKELFGMHPDDHADYDVFLRGLHPDDRDYADKENQDAINGKGNGDYDIEYRTIGLRDGKLRWVRAKGRSYRDEHNVTYRYAGTVIDITDQKMREQNLREQEERFRLLANSIPQIVWTTNEHGIVDYMSDKWELYTGNPPTYDKVSFRELMHPDDLGQIMPRWTECMEAGVTFTAEYRLKNIHTNAYRWYSCTTSPLIDQGGKVVKWIGSATDIDDQKTVKQNLEAGVAQRTRELSEINVRLEKSNDELEQYAYVTSHDLKEPLRKVIYYSSFLNDKFNSSIPPEALGYINRIENSALRMNALINDLLEYSKLAKGGEKLETVDLNNCITEVKNEYDFAMQEKNVVLETSQLPVIRGVATQINQLFSNLVSNAIKFSKPNASNKIKISAEVLSASEHTTYAMLSQSPMYYKITVTDEGIGFDSAYREQIFSIFQRLNHRSRFEGHGIGLALCRKIVHNHKGLIFADGVEGKGAMFTIIFPG